MSTRLERKAIDGRQPIRFLLGGKQVIDGLDEGVTCMKVGERRQLLCRRR